MKNKLNGNWFLIFTIVFSGCIPVSIKRMVRLTPESSYAVVPYSDYLSVSDSGSTYVYYQTKDEMQRELSTYHQHSLLSVSDNVANGGRLVVFLERSSLEMCNTRRFTFILQNSNDEIVLNNEERVSHDIVL